MAKTFVKVEGLKELENALLQLPRATSKNVMKRALMNAGQPVADMAESLAPVKTGALQRAISVGSRLTRRQKKASPKQSGVEVYVGVARSLPQGIFQEFGTVHDAPQPFLRPAWDALQTQVLNSVKENLWAEIKKAADRAARKAARLAAKMGA